MSAWQREASRETLAAAEAGCWQLLAEHPEKFPIVARYELADIAVALAHAKRSAGGGKILLV